MNQPCRCFSFLWVLQSTLVVNVVLMQLFEWVATDLNITLATTVSSCQEPSSLFSHGSTVVDGLLIKHRKVLTLLLSCLLLLVHHSCIFAQLCRLRKLCRRQLISLWRKLANRSDLFFEVEATINTANHGLTWSHIFAANLLPKGDLISCGCRCYDFFPFLAQLDRSYRSTPSQVQSLWLFWVFTGFT